MGDWLKMTALPTPRIHVRSKPLPSKPLSIGGLVWTVGALLIVLLVFTTSTVFVQQAWALQSFQIGIYAVVAVYLLIGLRKGREDLAREWTAWLVYLIPVWGIVQLVATTTVSRFETRAEVLRWGSLAGVFFLSQVVTRTPKGRRLFLSVFLGFATCMAVLCILQIFTSDGKVLWIFSSGYPDVYGSFPNANNYAQFVEVALPIALWRGLREGGRSWGYTLAGGVLYASVIASASRAGAVLSTAEVIVMLVIGLAGLRGERNKNRVRSTVAILLLVPALAGILTLAVGWQHVWERFKGNDPFGARKEFFIAAVNMARNRPLTGFGLGTFPEVYQEFAIKDIGMIANHAHNDWAEFAADGGIPFLLLILIPFAAAIPIAFRHPWGLGLVFVMIHACVDYPFPRPAVSGWMFAVLGALYMASRSDKRMTNGTPDTNRTGVKEMPLQHR
jgi:O-antigen ligase